MYCYRLAASHATGRRKPIQQNVAAKARWVAMDTAMSTVSCACAKPMKVHFPATFLEGGKSVFWDKKSLGFLQTHYLIFTVCCLTSFTPSPPAPPPCYRHGKTKIKCSMLGFITLGAQDAFVCLQDRFCTDVLSEKTDTRLQCAVLSGCSRLQISDWVVLMKFYLL